MTNETDQVRSSTHLRETHQISREESIRRLAARARALNPTDLEQLGDKARAAAERLTAAVENYERIRAEARTEENV